MNQSISINVIETNGIIDETATERDFHSKLHAIVAERADRLERITGAVATIFDRFPGKRVNLPHLATMVLVALNVDPEEYSKWEPPCLDYIRSNCQGDKLGDSVERPDSLFVMGSGRNGGVCRRVNQQKAA